MKSLSSVLQRGMMCKSVHEEVVYLAGAMESAQDGKSWRNLVSDKLGEYGICVWNPYTEEARLFSDSTVEFLKTHDKESEFDLIHRRMKLIVAHDLHVISNKITRLVANIDKYVLLGSGTHAEFSLAAYLGIPVYVWINGLTLSEVPSWAIGCFDYVFYNIDDIVDKVINDITN